MNRFLYAILFIPAFLLALLPFRILFLVSDFFFLIIYYIVRYRRKLVYKNLIHVFPDKTPAEIRKIEKKFYRHFCDYFVETIKLLHISGSEMKKHFVFINTEHVQNFLDKKQPVVLLLGHYGNWEWITSFMLYLKDDSNTIFGQVYRPFKNKIFDRFILRLRNSFHSISFTKHSIYRDIVNFRKENKNWIIGFMSDQKPSGNQVPHRMLFMNQETDVLTGTEKIARKTGAAVFYLEISYLKRGYYEVNPYLITDNSIKTSEFEITEKFIHCLEKTIQRYPPAYLWTHNRWRLNNK